MQLNVQIKMHWIAATYPYAIIIGNQIEAKILPIILLLWMDHIISKIETIIFVDVHVEIIIYMYTLM